MDGPPIIALLTDFGRNDAFVGIMKGVILAICPRAQLVDISHDVPPQSIAVAQILLVSALPYFPERTTFLVVVDPGVGTDRRGIAVENARHRFVGPDNGVLTAAMDDDFTAVELAHPEYRLPHVSATFHGRDLFAPAAAHLANGISVPDLGPLVPSPVRRRLPVAAQTADGIKAEILYIDHFGNAFTSAAATDLRLIGERGPEDWNVETAGGIHIPLRRTYADVAAGSPVALVNSLGYVEVAVAMGSAARQLHLKVGDTVFIRPMRG